MSDMKKSSKNSLIVEEPAVAYGYANFSPLNVMMGGQYQTPSDFDLVNLVRAGVSKQSILALARKISLTIEEIYERGTAVLGNEKEFNTWMRTPNHALNNEVPLNLLDTSIGFNLILQVLGRIEYGVFS